MTHPQVEFSGACVDSRKIKKGELFVAIKGEKVDGHDFVLDALENGAAMAMVSRTIPGLEAQKQWLVKDTLIALSEFASLHRVKNFCPAIAITGSNGKTTVKEMCKQILPYPSYATVGNHNNHIGVPLCLMQLRPEHRYAVFELGANHIGEIAHTVAMVKPAVAVINNIGLAHVGEFGSVDNIAAAKGEIYAGLSREGVAIVNADDAYAHFWDNHLKHCKQVSFGIKNRAEVTARDMIFQENTCAQFTLVTPQGERDVRLRVPGLHNVYNALAAAASLHALNIDLEVIAYGLQKFVGVSGRMAFLQGIHSSLIIDDTYNANLSSTKASLEVLSKQPGRRWFVFGDMGELGPWAQEHHREVGSSAREMGIDRLFSYGELSLAATEAFGLGAEHFKTQDALTTALLLQLDEQTTVLVKGSRASVMENIVAKLVV